MNFENNAIRVARYERNLAYEKGIKRLDKQNSPCPLFSDN